MRPASSARPLLVDGDDEDDGDEAGVTSAHVFVDGGGSQELGTTDLDTGPGPAASDARVPELGDDLTVVRESRISMADALRQLERTGGPAIEAKFELGEDGTLSLSVYPPERSEFVVPDAEHLTRAARDLTLVQASELTLIDAVDEAEESVPGGFVFWAIPTLGGTRAGYASMSSAPMTGCTICSSAERNRLLSNAARPL